LQEIVDAADRVLALSEQHHYPQTANWAHYFRGIAHYHRNELAQAEQELSVVVLDRHRAHLQCLVHGAMALAFTHQAQQRPVAARTVAALIPTFLYETGNTLLLPTIRAFRAELAVRQGNLAEASQWAAQTQPTGLDPMPHFFAHRLTLPKVLLALDTPASRAAAAVQLSQLCESAEATHFTPVLIEVLVLQAVFDETQGDRPAALAALERAIGLAQPGGFIRLFVDLGPPLQTLLRQLHDQSAAPHFVAQILAAFAAPQPIEPAAPLGSPGLIEPLTKRELEVLALLEQRLSNKEIATRLFITPSTAKQHTLRIYQKLQVNARHDAVAKAQSLGLVASR
jgi:LuxR family maltose regulon positive regulatory protein